MPTAIAFAKNAQISTYAKLASKKDVFTIIIR
jgi:hypothetical protein